MPSRDQPARGIIIPFPAAAIRRPPAPAFVTQPVIRPRIPPRGRAVLTWLALCSLLAALLAGAWLLGTATGAARRRAERRAPAPGAALRATVPGSVNLLVAGLDADDGVLDEAGARSDAILLLHLDADREQAWIISFPRDARVSLPGQGDRRIDAAYALGGPALFVETLERLTGLPIDHVAVFDRTGLRRLTDGVGGVPLSLEPPGGADPAPGGLALELSGAMALDYVSEPRRRAGGEPEHIHREHLFLRSLLAQLLERGVLADPAALRDLAASLGASVRVDAGLTPAALRSLLDSARHLRAEDVTFLTVPVRHSGPAGVAEVVRPDGAGCAQLWDALAHDEMPAFVATHPELVTPVATP